MVAFDGTKKEEVEKDSKPKYVTVEKESTPTKSQPPSEAEFSNTAPPGGMGEAPSSNSEDQEMTEQTMPSASADSSDTKTTISKQNTTPQNDDFQIEVGAGNLNASGGKGKKIAVFIIIFTVIAGLVAGGVYYYRTNLIPSDDLATPTEIGSEIPTSTPSPTPTPVPEKVNLSELSVNILNGSGIPGEAGKVQTLLENAGFENIETGNADSYDYLNTKVDLRLALSPFVFDSISEALGQDYNIVESGELDEDSVFDVVVIVGSKSPDKDTTTPTPSPVSEK